MQHKLEQQSHFVSISRIHFPVTALGPGNRVGIWFQGCTIRCPGCISADTWPQVGSNITVSEILNQIAALGPQLDGVTISGGEPFDQPHALRELLTGIRERLLPTIDVLVYTGFAFAVVEAFIASSPGLVDALISEPFVAAQPQTRSLMGSDNQQLHLLTPLGRQRFRAFDRSRNDSDDRLDVMFDSEGVTWMAGIPRRGTLEQLQELLAAEGTSIRTTEHRGT